MDEDFPIAVSPRHSVRLAREFASVVKKAPRRDYVVRTLTKREANGMPLMSAEIVIAGEEARAQFPLAAEYPLHFRKTYYPGRLHGDPEVEFQGQARASELIGVPPPIGFGPQVFRACLIPGKSYGSLSPFQSEPEERNLRHARELDLMAAAGQWRLAEQAFELLDKLHAGGLAHGDADLRNFIVCPAPLEIAPVDFEAAIRREGLSDSTWETRSSEDFDALLRHAVLLQCSLGAQTGPLAERAAARMDRLFRQPDVFRRAIEQHSDLES